MDDLEWNVDDSVEQDAAMEKVLAKGLELYAHKHKWHKATLKMAAEKQGMADVPMIKELIEKWPRVYGKPELNDMPKLEP